ncbi:acyltransferase [Dermatophilaceae bacterium Sec6.4]
MGFVPALDGLRAVAIGLVILYHLHLGAFAGGNDGVDVFFVLSGFLITTLLIQERSQTGQLDLPRFYVRRFARLVPALAIVLIGATALLLISGTTEKGYFLATASAFLYLTPFTRLLLHLDGVYDYTWTLALEEYFYLAWPATLIFMMNRRWSWKQSSFALALITIFLYSTYAILLLDGTEISLLRVAGISAGCAYAFAHRHLPKVSQPGFLTSFGLILIASGTAVGANQSQWSIAFPVVALGSILTIRGVASAKTSTLGKALGWAPVAYLGAISYELYLWHYPIFLWFERALDTTPAHMWWAAVPAALLCAAGTHALAVKVQRRVNGAWRSRGRSSPESQHAVG